VRDRQILGVSLLLALFASGGPGCAPQYPPDRFAVADLEIVSDDSGEESEVINADELRAGLATAESSFWAKLLAGHLVEYEEFDETVLARDLERIERYYQARGYYEAKVTATRVEPADEDFPKARMVRVFIQVREGDPVRIAERVKVTGVEQVPLDPVGVAVVRAVALDEGDVFDEAKFEDTKEAIVEALADNGYAFAEVRSRAEVDLSRHLAWVAYEIDPGPRAVYGRVAIVGLDEIPEQKVRDALFIEEGKLYSRADLRDAEKALESLGVFSSVEVRQDLTQRESGRVPITVAVRESLLRTVRLGVGARIDALELSTHLRAGWEDRNFLGGMRRFSIDTRPGLSYFPLRVGRPFERPIRLLPKNKLNVQLRQPAFLEGRTTGFVSGEYNVYPLLYSLPPGLDPQGERIIGYHELYAHTGLERAFFNFHLTVVPSYNYRANFPFTYRQDMPDGLSVVRVSYPELMFALDFRDDALSPHEGILLRNTVQVAGLPVGGDVQDVRVQPEANVFLPMSKAVTLALRTTVGFLFPMNYGGSLAPGFTDNPTDPAIIRDQHKLLFRVFYSGGPGSNRGYPFRGVGPHGPLGFLVRSTERCDFFPPDPAAVPASCLRPLGGLTLWEASMEVRFPILGPLRGATFLDASHVTREQALLRFDVPHLSPGFGVRYVTPVGPLRVDLGWHWVRTFVKDDPNTPENEKAVALGGEPDLQPLLGLDWMPRAIHIAIGEAF